MKYTLLVFIITCACLASTQTVNYEGRATEDVWVYVNSTDPTGDYYLRCWEYNISSDIWPTFPTPSDSSYSYFRFDLTNSFSPSYYYHVTDAKLTLTHKKSPGWTLAQPDVNLRKVGANWSEASWDFGPSSPVPCGFLASGDRSAYVAQNNTFPVKFNLDTQVFEDFLNSSLANGTINFAITSALNPLGPYGAAHYQFYSHDWPQNNVWPKLEISATAVPIFRITGILAMESLHPTPPSSNPSTILQFKGSICLQTLTALVRPHNSLTVLETHKIIPNQDGTYELDITHSGQLDIAFRGTNWLQAVQTVIVGSGTNTLNWSLINGDTNGDNIVEDQDLLNIINDFLSTPNVHGFSDLNADGNVDDADLLIVINRFLSQGQP